MQKFRGHQGKDVYKRQDYNSENALGTLDHKKAILRDLLEDFEPLSLRPSDIEVKPGQVPADVIGDAYEYMIGQFASMAGKKTGSFYTCLLYTSCWLT